MNLSDRDSAGAHLRVLFVTSMWPDEDEAWRGSFVKSQAESLERLGVRIDVELIRTRGAPSWRAYAAAGARAVGSNARKSAYDVVHAHYGHAGAVGRARLRAPLVISYCGADLLGVQRQDGSLTEQSRVEVAVFRQLARLAQATITKTRQMEQRLPAACRTRNHVIPNGVDLSRFQPLQRDHARRQLGWPPDERVALFVGDPGLAIKNHQLAEAVCRQAAASVPELRLRVAWGVRPEQIPTWMGAADALLVTSQSEGSPNAVKEAMAAGLPIVTTPVGDVRELLAGVDDCFVRPADVRSLAEALSIAVMQGRSEGARRAIADLSLEQVASRVLAVYRSVLQDPDPRGRARHVGGDSATSSCHQGAIAGPAMGSRR